MDIATFVAQNPWLLPFVLTVGLPVVGTNVAAVLRQKGFAPMENALIAWSVLIICAVGVALLEGLLVGGWTSIFASVCGIASLLVGGALSALSPYLLYLDWVEAHLFNVVQPVVVASTQTRTKAMMKETSAVAARQAAAAWTPSAATATKGPQPILLPQVTPAPAPQFILSPQDLPVTLPPTAQLAGEGAVQTAIAHPFASNVTMAPTSVQLPSGFTNLSQLNVTYPMAAMNQPQPPTQQSGQ